MVLTQDAYIKEIIEKLRKTDREKNWKLSEEYREVDGKHIYSVKLCSTLLTTEGADLIISKLIAKGKNAHIESDPIFGGCVVIQNNGL